MSKGILLPRHQSLLDASAISYEVATARGYRSITTKADLELLGFSRPQRNVPGLLLPGWNAAGEIAGYQYRPDSPRIRDGKPVKYEPPYGSHTWLDVPPSVQPLLGDPKVPLWITEGIRKADAAASQGMCCIALLGVWNWRGRNDAAGLTALGDWELIHLKGRDIYLAFDSDLMTNRHVHAALRRFKEFLA
jgi:hypothetical protein